MDPLFCLFCARSNPADARFCNECGTPLDLKPCRQCDAVNPRVADRCYRCEAALPVESTARAGAARAEPLRADSSPAIPEGTAADVVAQAGGALAALERGWQSPPAPVAGGAIEAAERTRGSTQPAADRGGTLATPGGPTPSTVLPVEQAVAQATPAETTESASAAPPPLSATVRKRAVVPGSAFERGSSRQYSPLTPASGARPLSPGPHAHAYPAREADVAPMAEAPVELAWAAGAVSTTGTTPWLADDHSVAHVSNDGTAEAPVPAAAVDAVGTLDDQRGPAAFGAGHPSASDDARWRVDPERLPDVEAIAPASPGSPVYAPRRARVLPAVLLVLLVGVAAAGVYFTQNPERLESLTQRARDVVGAARAPATGDASNAAPPPAAITSSSGAGATPPSTPPTALAPTASPTADVAGSDATSSTVVGTPPADAASAPASPGTPSPGPASTAVSGGPPADASARDAVAAAKAAPKGRAEARPTTTRPSRPAQRAPVAESSRPPSQAAPRSPSPDAPRAPCTPAVAALGLC
jgi:hypothetical protein